MPQGLSTSLQPCFRRPPLPSSLSLGPQGALGDAAGRAERGSLSPPGPHPAWRGRLALTPTRPPPRRNCSHRAGERTRAVFLRSQRPPECLLGLIGKPRPLGDWDRGCQAGARMDPNSRGALDRQQLRLRDRQKFFEEVFQQDSEFFFPLSHLHLESRRPPIGSISSMEVNVDTLEQAELIDFGDPDTSDVFLPCEELPPTPQPPTVSGVGDHPEELNLQRPPSDRTMSRTSSSSSSTELNTTDLIGDGVDTPLAQSDEEDGGAEPATCS